MSAFRRLALISPYDHAMNYGLRSLSAYLRAHGVGTRLVFLPTYLHLFNIGLSQSYQPKYSHRVIQQLIDLVRDCDGIGITMMSMDRPRVEALIDAVRPLGKPLVVGGIHPTVFPEDALQLADRIIMGEGYGALLDWCRDPERTDIPNLGLRKAGDVEINAVRPPITDLDALPFPDFGPEDHWLLHRGRIRPLDERLKRRSLGAACYVFATFGCPLSCSFCVNDRLKVLDKGYGRFRRHSVDYLIGEIRHQLRQSPDLEYVYFADDGFGYLPEDYVAEFAERYRREINLPFCVMGLIPAYVERRKIELLVSAGLKRVRMGMQSVNKQAMRSYRRGGSRKQYHRCNDWLQAYPNLVFPYYDIIVDNPLIDSEQDMRDNIEFLLELKGRFTLHLYALRMYAGTRIHDVARERGLDERYFEGSYTDMPRRLLPYILTWIQCSGGKWIPRALLRLYDRFGNVPVPGPLFSLNRALWLMRCGVEHVRKKDVALLPRPLARLLVGSFRSQLPGLERGAR